MSNATQEITARLLATENITVLHENIPTAMFNVKERTLHLPLWEDMDADTYSHLIGHEVGHAKYTPEEGWHDAVCDRGTIFKNFLNVVEDARIEKLIQRRYPGLRKSFVKSYKKMLADGFFGKNIDQINKGHLIDRINTYFKCGMSAGVRFDASERVWLDEIAAAETWEQVEDISTRLYEFAREQAKQELEEQKQQQEQLQQEAGDEVEESEDDQDETDEMDAFDELFSGESGVGDLDEDDTDDNQEEYEQSASGGTDPMTERTIEDDIDDKVKSETEEQLRKSIDSEYGQMSDGKVVNVRFKDFDMNVVPYAEVIDEVENGRKHPYIETRIPLYDFRNASQQLWSSFASENKRVVNHMVKEFEMRKKAAEYVRASTSKTGVIDNVKMNNYKLTDDIFKKVTVVPEGKNHGFLIFLDFSGSMMDCLFSAAEQTLTLAMFCRQANIPFRVMTFTSHGFESEADRFVNTGLDFIQPLTDTNVVELFNDKMRKSEFAKMAGYLLAVGYGMGRTRKLYQKYGINSYYNTPYTLGLGGTPLDEVVLGTVKMHDQFKAKYRLDKVNTFFISDGESAPVSYNAQITEDGRMLNSWFETTHRNQENIYRLVDDKTGRRYRCTGDRYTGLGNSLSQNCVRLYRERTGSTTIGYRIVSHNYHEVEMVSRPYNNNSIDIWSELRGKLVSEISGTGYDQYFLISKKGLEVQGSDLEVKGDMTKGKLRTAFKKAQGNKKASRELTNRIMEMVA